MAHRFQDWLTVRMAAVFTVAALAGPARAQGVIHAPDPLAVEYGFLSNSDMDKAGTLSVEVDNVSLFNRRGRHFLSSDTQINIAYALTDHVQVTIGPQLTYSSLHNVDGMFDARRFVMGGIGGDLRWRLVDRRSAPFGLTVQISPQMRFANEAVSTGRGFGIATTVALDRELIADRLYGTLNLSHEATRQRFDDMGRWENGARIGVGLGLAVPVIRAVHLGGEMRYFRRYDGFEMARFQGQALYVGPSVYSEIGRNAWVSLSWQTQVAGRETGRKAQLDLAGFERHQVRLRVGYEF